MSEPTLSSTGLLADGTQQLDINGRPITPRRRRWGMNVNLLCAALGTLFAITYWPGSGLFSMYLQERLGATEFQIGFFSGIVGIGQLAQLVGVYIFDRTRTRKVLWVTMVLIYRFTGFVIVGLAIYAHYHQGDARIAWRVVWAMLGMTALAFSMAQLTANAWWSWIADLTPESTRGRFLGNRQVVANIASLMGSLPVILLDTVGKKDGHYTDAADWIFISIFASCTLAGIADIIIHAFIPEPARLDRPDATGLGDTLRNLVEPLRNASFRRFTLAMTLGGFSVMFWSPFVWPYLKGADFINVEYTVYLVAIGLSSLGILVSSRYWGVIVDRFGAKPVLAITYTAGFFSVYLFFITPENAWWLVPSVGGLLGGLMWSGYMLAGAQLMLTLSPTKTRNSYVATHAAVTGSAIIASPMLAGWLGNELREYFSSLPYVWKLPTGTVVTHMQVLVLIGIVMRVVVYPLIMRIREGNEKPIGIVLATVLGPSQFRTLWAMRVIGGRTARRKVDALRGMASTSDRLAVDDLIAQLEDAEPEVRREAVLALGRIGGAEAMAALESVAADSESDLQPEAAYTLERLKARGNTNERQVNALRRKRAVRDESEVDRMIAQVEDADPAVRREAVMALGRVGGQRAVDRLIELLNDPQADLQAEAAMALGLSGDGRAIRPLLNKLADPNEMLREDAAGALAEFPCSPVGKALMATLKTDSSPAVFGRAALSLAKMGVSDAVWEIVPRMHTTKNVGLRRQLAVAVGDLLGCQGDYYELINGERREPGSHVHRLTSNAIRTLRAQARQDGSGARADLAPHLLLAAKHLQMAMEEYEFQRYDLTIGELNTATMELLHGFYEFSDSADVAVEFALSRNPTLGVGLWCLRTFQEYAGDRPAGDEALALDALLGFHMMKAFLQSIEKKKQ